MSRCERFVCSHNLITVLITILHFLKDDFSNDLSLVKGKEASDIKMFKFLSEKPSDKTFVTVSVSSLIDQLCSKNGAVAEVLGGEFRMANMPLFFNLLLRLRRDSSFDRNFIFLCL